MLQLNNIKSNITYKIHTPIKNYIYNDIYFKNYSFIKTIYEKTNKVMYIIQCIKSNKKYILKGRSISDYNNQQLIIYTILKESPHENIVKFIDFIIRDKFIFYICEYIEGVDLSQYLQQNSYISELDIRDIFIQITQALKHIHDLNIIHCDIKLENIIITHNKHVIITDFDLAKICVNELILNKIIGTIGYIAPESYDIYVYSKKSDIWCLGIMLYVFVARRFPYNGKTLEDFYCNMYRWNIFRHIDFSTIEQINVNICSILKKILVFEDHKRLTLDEIINYLNKLNVKKLIYDTNVSTIYPVINNDDVHRGI